MDNLLRFFLPAFDGSVHALLQLSFAALFVLAMTWMPLAVRRSAQSAQWDANFKRLNDHDELSHAYSSASDLGDAVATRAEGWADILPSMLLVFGLLGTFIGLGLALTEAAGALAGGGDAIGNLTPIMDSLGSKFKTSTWGILAFLGLKICFMLKPYEERRNAWAASKLRELAACADLRVRRERDAERDAMANVVETATDAISGVLQEGHQRMLASAREQHDATIDVLRNLLLELQKSSERQAAHSVLQAEKLTMIADHGDASRFAMEQFTHGVQGNIERMSGAANDMASAAQSANEASGELRVAVGELRNNMTAVLQDVKSALETTIGSMSDRFAADMTSMAANLAGATTGIERAVAGLSQGVEATIADMQKNTAASMGLQQKAYAEFSSSAEQLNTSIISIQDATADLGARIEKGLTAISATNARMLSQEKAGERLQREVIDKLEAASTDIGVLAQEIMQRVDRAAEQERLVDAVAELKRAILALAQAGASRHEAPPLIALQGGHP